MSLTAPDNPSSYTPPIALGAVPSAEHLGGARVPVSEALLGRLRDVCAEVLVDDRSRAEAGRDWWPIAIGWAIDGEVPALPAVVARPGDAAQCAAVLAACNDAHVPVTPVAGRSGVCGASVPVFGGVSLDMCGVSGVDMIDTHSLLAELRPGTFGPDLETALQKEGVTAGHWPQSMDLSTVGGWVACRGAGQYSTRYGKIEDMVAGLEVALADGRIIRTGGVGPRAAVGPDLTQLFVGSEGVLGVVTKVTLRVHPTPPDRLSRAYGFSSVGAGLDACRRILRRGATPAVLRLYDQVESERNFDVDDQCLLIVLDEADPVILAGTDKVVSDECARSTALDSALVDRWLSHRNDVSALASLYQAGIVVDTIEIAAPWRALDAMYDACVGALRGLQGTLAASAHQSHSYIDGACLYFTFAGRPPEGADAEWKTRYYSGAWDAVTEIVRSAGGAISHHHGIGVNRSRFVAEALGGGFDVLRRCKEALDPRGILNPGKLGLPSPFGELRWP
ncbi:MAG: FAD-binding oxidoreductase [Acidimicrobiales bacterium]